MEIRYYRISSIQVVGSYTIAGVVDLGYHTKLSTTLTLGDSNLLTTLKMIGSKDATIGVVGSSTIVSIEKHNPHDDRLWRYPVLEIVKVIDGDTLDARLDLGFSLVSSQRFRFNHVDTFELRSKDAQQKALAYEAKRFTTELVNTTLKPTIRSTKTEKYGRWLGDIYLSDGTYLNKLLVEKGLTKSNNFKK